MMAMHGVAMVMEVLHADLQAVTYYLDPQSIYYSSIISLWTPFEVLDPVCMLNI